MPSSSISLSFVSFLYNYCPGIQCLWVHSYSLCFSNPKQLLFYRTFWQCSWKSVTTAQTKNKCVSLSDKHHSYLCHIRKKLHFVLREVLHSSLKGKTLSCFHLRWHVFHLRSNTQFHAFLMWCFFFFFFFINLFFILFFYYLVVKT